MEEPSIKQDFIQHGRDLRLDFLRGMVMLVVICVHLEYLSVLSMFMWERLGLFSSAEGFVSLSGVVLGIVYRKKLFKEGFQSAALKLWRRAGQLYTVNVGVVASILLLRLVPGLNTFSITHWVPIAGGNGFHLFPEVGSPWQTVLKEALLLQIGPHQFQVIGLYTVLIFIAPLVLYALHRNKLCWVMLCSWGIYIANIWLGYRLTPLKFEYAFPSLSWQLLFFNGMVIGFYHQPVFAYLSTPRNKWLIYISGICLSGFMFLALSNPHPYFWPWDTGFYHDKDTYQHMYDRWFSKERLGFGRIFNNMVLYIFLFAFISRYWQYCNRFLGWLVVPIGQASLYVFIWHVYFVLLFSNTVFPTYNNLWVNTLIHLVSIGLIWLMIKKRFMFGLVPR